MSLSKRTVLSERGSTCDIIVGMNTQETQKLFKWGFIALVVLVVFLGIQTLVALKNLRNTSPSYNTITVSGEGETFAVPDVASFNFTVSADASTVSAAQEQVTEKMDRVLSAIKNLGIEEKDIKTTDYSVYPRYSYTREICTSTSCTPGRQVLDGYTASHNVTVKVRNTEEAGQALATAGDNGATGLSSISFTIDDPDALAAEARELAIADAREKAELLSEDLDVRLVRVVSFSDSTDGMATPYYVRESMGAGNDMAMAQKAPELPMGENKVRVNVSVTYEIR